MLWSWRCYGHFGHKRLRGISSICNRFSKILIDFGRFSAVFSNFSRFSVILGDLQRFWAISGYLGTLLGALGRSWGALGVLLGRSWALLGRSWALLGTSWTPPGRLLGATWKKSRCYPLVGPQLGGQNPAKLAPKSLKNQC